MAAHRITCDRVQGVLKILEKAQEEKPLVSQRLDLLSGQLEALMTEIEQFKNVHYCRDAAACYLDNAVVRVLSGSRVNTATLSRHYSPDALESRAVEPVDSGYVFVRDYFFHAPSPAASFILQRSAGPREWKRR